MSAGPEASLENNVCNGHCFSCQSLAVGTLCPGGMLGKRSLAESSGVPQSWVQTLRPARAVCLRRDSVAKGACRRVSEVPRVP